MNVDTSSTLIIEAMLSEKALIQTAQSYVEVGKEFSQEGCFEEAVSSFRKALEFKADYVEAYNLIAQIYARQENWDDCIAIFRNFVELNPGNPQAYLALGDALRKAGRSKQSLEICRQAVGKEHVAPGIYRLLGNLMEGEEQFDDAVRHYRKFLELRPNSPWGYVFLARSLQKAGRFNEVDQCCEQALKYEQFVPDVLRLRADALRKIENLDAAIYYYRRYLELKPESATVYVELGDTLLRSKKFDEVIDCCYRAKQQQHIEPGVYRLLGAAFQNQGQLEGAVSNYQAFLNLKPDVAWAYAALGKVLQRQGNLDEAVNCFKEADKRGHARQQMNQLIADTYKEQGKLDDAVPFYQIVLELKSNSQDGSSSLTSIASRGVEFVSEMGTL